MRTAENPVIIVGGGIAGLACARRLQDLGIPVRILEVSGRTGGRVKTDQLAGYRLDRGFQVLHTAYPEAQRALDFPRLDLRRFAPGAMIRIRGRFYTVADPLRRPKRCLTRCGRPSAASRIGCGCCVWPTGSAAVHWRRFSGNQKQRPWRFYEPKAFPQR
ncbi:flavin containing amine oxidase [Desulfosarcina variabilis str. Montpellier]|uniref:FAD-dependent oxidoreductase n=1 Tax=Desulfosarcina variabilis TaxID=2300 RepID=UPI003AFA9F9C